jgi:hypothetical protein
MFDTNRAPILRQDYHYLQMDWNELSLEPRLIGVPSGAIKMISEPMVRLAQTMHLSCTDTNTVSKQEKSEISQDQRHLGVPSVASKMVFVPMACTTQTMHLSCVKISSISERIETSFHLSLVT